MAQREVLEHQGVLGPDPAEEADEDEGDHAGHHRSGRPKVNVDEADGVNRRHTRLEGIQAECDLQEQRQQKRQCTDADPE